VVVKVGLWSGMVECFLGFDVAADPGQSHQTLPASDSASILIA
jgi:hypothetical protein